MVLVGALRDREGARGAKCRKGRAISLAALSRRVEGEMQNPARRLDRRERARMHLAQDGGTQRGGREPRISSEGNVRGHRTSGRMGRPFLQAGGGRFSPYGRPISRAGGNIMTAPRIFAPPPLVLLLAP